MPRSFIREISALAALVLVIFGPAQIVIHNNIKGWMDLHSNSNMLNGQQAVGAATTITQLSRQTQIQQEFRQLIQQSQAPQTCPKARALIVDLDEEYDGFALEVRSMSYFLQIAVATNRALVVYPGFTSAYAPQCENTNNKDISQDSSKGGRWSCLWNPVSNCTNDEVKSGTTKTTDDIDMLPEPMGVGILEDHDRSGYFNVQYYGPRRIEYVERFMHLDRTQLIDVIPHWERMYGRFWVRSQISDYFWKHATNGLKQEIELRMPRTLLDMKEPYIGFHIRMTDNVRDLARDFGRDASVTRKFERFMEIANNIRRDHPTLQHIYVATDNSQAANITRRGSDEYPNWTFHIQNNVARGESQSEFMWFRNSRAGSAGAIGADVETLRRADFLVGSFQSNVYRLSAELNVGYHTGRYLWDEKRIYTVDVEWYEDP